jgi:hypothetical protein
MNTTNNMLDEVVDLATIMRPFLMGKRGPVVMTTLCMLTAEALLHTGANGTVEQRLAMVDNCVRDYVSQLEKIANDAP